MNRKKREGIVYSTDPGFNYEDKVVSGITLPAAQQQLYVWIESKGRKGKTVSIVKGFVGAEKDLETLTREIKTSCGTGGSSKNGEIIIQGDFRERIIRFLTGKGYKTKRAGG